MRFSPSTARRFQESRSGVGIFYMKIQVGFVHLVTSAHKRCCNAAFSLLVVIFVREDRSTWWNCAFSDLFCVQNAFFIFNQRLGSLRSYKGPVFYIQSFH